MGIWGGQIGGWAGEVDRAVDRASATQGRPASGAVPQARGRRTHRYRTAQPPGAYGILDHALPGTLPDLEPACQLTMLGAAQRQTTVPCRHGEILPWMTQLPRLGKKTRLIATLARGHDGGGGTAPICRSRPRVSQWTHSSTNLPSTIWLSSCPST
jgi:hypothetical protein